MNISSTSQSLQNQAPLRDAQEKSLEPSKRKPCTFGEKIWALWESKIKAYVQGCLKASSYHDLPRMRIIPWVGLRMLHREWRGKYGKSWKLMFISTRSTIFWESHGFGPYSKVSFLFAAAIKYGFISSNSSPWHTLSMGKNETILYQCASLL